MVKLSATFNGVMDRDSDDRYIKQGNYRMLKNGIIDRTKDGGRYLVKNLPSTKLLSALPDNLGTFVGGEIYKENYYPFYYDSITNELSMLRVDINSGEYKTVFSKDLSDSILVAEGDDGGGGSSTYDITNSFVLMNDGVDNFVYITSALKHQEDVTVNTTETEGVAFGTIAEVNARFQLLNADTVDECVICNKPIVVSGEAYFKQADPSETVVGFTDLPSWTDYFTIKNKGLADEYIVCSAPLYVKEDITAYSTDDFAQGEDFSFGTSSTEPRNITYNPVERISDINFIEDQASGDLFCYWTDGVNPPWKINVTWAEGQYPDGYTYVRDMFNAKIVPSEPTISYYRDYSISNVNTQNSCFQFAQRYVYKDGEKTPLSTYSGSAFIPDTLLTSSETTSAQEGFYVDNGFVYRFTGFDSSTSTKISDGHDPAYDTILSNETGDVLIMYTTGGSNKPVKRSFDGGFTWKNGSSEQFEALGCMSKDGSRLYMASENLYRSDDYGQTFTKIRDDIGEKDLVDKSQTILRCNDDGSVLLLSVAQSDKYSVRILKDYGTTAFGAGINYSYDVSGEQYTGWSGDISPSGQNIVVFLPGKKYVSRNYGEAFNQYTGPSEGVDDVVIYDSGIGYADGYITTSFFEGTLATFEPADQIFKYNYGVVYKDGTTFTLYDLDGTLQATTTLAFTPAFTDNVDIRTAISNIKNLVNVVDVSIEKPNNQVEKVEVFAINVYTGTTYLIDSVKNTDIPVDGTTVTFKNNLVYRLLSETEKSVLYSNVPLVAKHQAIIGDRLFYLNYTDGRSVPSVDFSVTPQYGDFLSSICSTSITNNTVDVTNSEPSSYDLYPGALFVMNFTYRDPDENVRSLSFVHVFQDTYSAFGDAQTEIESSWQNLFSSGSLTSITNGFTFNTGEADGSFLSIDTSVLQDFPITYKKGHAINIGIVYYDEYNRGSFPLFDDTQIVINEDISQPKVSLRATINHEPPDWAYKYKFVRTDRDLIFRIIPGFQHVKAEQGYIYLQKYEVDKYLPDPGMYLDVHLDDGSILSFQVENKVTKEADFVEGSPAGEWIVIKEGNVDGFTASNVSSGTSKFLSSTFYARQSIEQQDDILFYEIPGEYRTMGGYHVDGTQDQTDSQPAIIDIKNDGNVWYLQGAGIELINIGEGLTYANGGRALLEIETPQEINRYSSITWSDKYVQDTGYNGLSMFNLGTVNFKSLEINNGPINAAFPLETNLYIWQRDKVGYVLINKNAITTALGEKAISSANQVAGEFVPYIGLYGSIHPESITLFGGRKYFVDAERNAICRLSQDGITELSAKNMTSVFHDWIDKNTYFLSVVNRENQELWVYGNGEIYVFDEKWDGWSRAMGPLNVDHMFADDKTVYSVDGNKIYAHMRGSDYGTLHDNQVDFEFEYVNNEGPETIKIYNTHEMEANKPVKTEFYLGGNYNSGESFNSSIIEADNYETREGEYFAYVPGSNNVSLDQFSEISATGGVLVPLGKIKSIDSTVATLTSETSSVVGEINHFVFVMNGDIPEYRGSLTNINSNSVTSSDSFVSEDVGRFAFLVENSYLNGHKIRAPYVRVKFTDNGDTEVSIFASRLEAIVSKNQ